MSDQQLLNYINQQLRQGFSQEQIKHSLVAGGWSESDVNAAFATLPGGSTSMSQIPAAQQGSVTPLPGATTILKQAISLYRGRMGTFLGIMVFPTLAIFGTGILMSGGILGLRLLSPAIAGGMIIFLLTATLSIVIIAIQVWGQIALLYAIKGSQEGIGVKESYRRGWHKIISYWWVALLVTFITIGGYLLFVIPGIIFTIWFSLALFVMIAEDSRGMSALAKSREYVKGHFGGVLWRFIFIGVLAIILSIPVLILTKIAPSFVANIIQLIVGIFLTPLMVAYSFLIYSHLKNIKGEFSLQSSGKQKAIFAISGILGFLIIPASLAAILLLSPKLPEVPPEIEIQFAVENWCDINDYNSCEVLDIAFSSSAQVEIADVDIHAFKSSTQGTGFYIRLNKNPGEDWGVTDADGYWLEGYEPDSLEAPELLSGFELCTLGDDSFVRDAYPIGKECMTKDGEYYLEELSDEQIKTYLGPEPTDIGERAMYIVDQYCIKNGLARECDAQSVEIDDEFAIVDAYFYNVLLRKNESYEWKIVLASHKLDICQDERRATEVYLDKYCSSR